MQSWQTPGLKNVLGKCRNLPQPFSIPGAGQSANANAAPPDPVLPATTAIPGELAREQSWKVVWSWQGSNVDGPIAGNNGTVFVRDQRREQCHAARPVNGPRQDRLPRHEHLLGDLAQQERRAVHR